MIYKKEYYNSADHFTCEITPKRIAKNYELEIYDYGSGCASINNVLYPHNKNMVIFAKPHLERFTRGSFACYAIHFMCDDDKIQKLLNNLPDCIVTDSLTKQQLLELFESAYDTGSLETIASITKMLVILKNSNSHITNNITPQYERIVKAKEYIDNNYQKDININDLEKMLNLSTNYIRKLFLDCYGITIHKYITELRLSHVQKLLVSTDLALCDIALESGFNSQSHMNYMFKSFYGVTPLKFKKEKFIKVKK